MPIQIKKDATSPSAWNNLSFVELIKKNILVSEDVIKKIKAEFPILELVRFYVQLRMDKNRNIIGVCPFCNNSKKAFRVNIKLNIFKCFDCKKGGTPINFIMEYENLKYGDAIFFISGRFFETLNLDSNANSLKGNVYVLELVNNCYYIGFTNDIERRWIEHYRGHGAIWTAVNKPIKIIENHPNKTLYFENYLTEKYINKYGYSKVRGGDHIYFKNKYGHFTTNV